jgi:peptidyl-prolyl cis-trans isomerase SurA
MVRLRFGAILATVIIGSVLIPGAFAQKVLEEVVARVGNDIILKSEYESERKALRDDLTQKGLQGAQLEQVFQEQSKDILRNLVDNSLLVQQAKDMGISADLEVVKREEQMRQEQNRQNPQKPINSIDELEKAISQQMSLDDFKQRIKTTYLRNQVLAREVYNRVIISTEELRKYYDAHTKDFDRPAGVHLREITVNIQGMGPAEAATQKKKIDDALTSIRNGADFGESAQKTSESDTAQSGGDLGFFEDNSLAKDFEDIVLKLDKGQVSDVVQTKDQNGRPSGFMILKVDDRHAGGVLPFESAQNEVYNQLFQEKAMPKVRDYLNKLRTDGFVEIKEGYVDTGAVKAN